MECQQGYKEIEGKCVKRDSDNFIDNINKIIPESNLSYKTKIIISIIIDGLDFLLALPAFLAYLSVVAAPFASLLNNIRDIVYDLIAIPISIYFWGFKNSYVTMAETIIPAEFDFFIPSVTLSGLLNRRNRK